MIELIVVIAMLTIACGCGHIVLACIGLKRFHAMLDREVLAVALGVIVFAVASLALAICGLLTSFAARTTLITLAIIGGLGFAFRHRRESFFDERAERKSLSFFSIFLMIIFLAFCVFNLVNALIPTINHDTLSVYFFGPKLWIQSNALKDIEFHFVDNFVFWISIMHSFCMLLYTDILAQLFNTYCMGVLLALVVFMLARRYFRFEIAILSAAIFYSSYCNVWLSSSGRINFMLSLYEVLSVYCFFAWVDSDSLEGRKWIVLSGIFSGFAIGVHIAGLKTIVVLVFLYFFNIFFVRSRQVNGRAKWILIFVLAAAMFASPVFIRNVLDKGNPVFPLLHNVFGGEEYTGMYKGDILGRGQRSAGVYDFVFILLDITVKPWHETRSMTICPLIIVFGPLFVLLKKPHRKALQFLGVALLLYILWFFSQRMARYALNYLALLSVVASYTACMFIESRRRVISILIIGAIFIFFLLELERDIRGYHPDSKRLKTAVGLMSRDNYIYQASVTDPFHPNYRICCFINKNLDKGSKVFGTSEPESYWIDRPYLSVREDDGTDLYYQTSPVKLISMMKEQGITHVLYSQRYIDKVNQHMRRTGVMDKDFFPRSSLFSSERFRTRYLRRMIEDHTDELFEVQYPSDESL